ncbi:hypothetical protein BDV06DRAFT_183060 [Aspergillus oleicola]
MNRDVVEGNSTSLKSSTRFSNPQEPSALMDLSHLHMDDLGLTPFPGFQLRGNILQAKEQNCSNHEVVDISGSHDGINQADGEGTSKNQNTDLRFEAQSSDAFGLNEDLYDPLFDSTVPELESVFSRKRTADSQELPPEKRQHLESPSETPSLTTDSTHESPALFFDTFDNFFANGFDVPLLPDDPLLDFDEVIPPLIPPAASQLTRERFSLDDQDVLANNTHEFLRIGKQPEYDSPYSISGGPLGYLPSNPGLHVKSIAVGKTKKDSQILELQAKLGQLTRERDQYKKSLSQYATLNEAGKSPEQLLREENASLRRVSSRHQARVEEYKKEAVDWRNQLHTVSTMYNNLLYEIQVNKRLPAVASIPAGYKPPKIASVPAPVHQSNAPQTAVQSRTPISNSQTPQSTATQPTRPETCQSVTIDLTDDTELPPTPPAESEPGATLQTLRSKKYGWLNGASRGTSTANSPTVDEDELALMMEAELSRA